jgi:LysM repeat protein
MMLWYARKNLIRRKKMKNRISMNRLIQRASIVILALVLAAGVLAAFVPNQAVLASSSCQKTVSVRSGDTLGTIAEKYDVAIDDLTKANSLHSPYYTIYVGQKLCIPSDAKHLAGIPKFATALAADFSARLSGKSVNLKTANFPKNSTYYVKVGSGSNSASEKIGQINTGAGGTLSPTFALPTKLQNAAKVSVCLKNAVTDANVCRTATR